MKAGLGVQPRLWRQAAWAEQWAGSPLSLRTEQPPAAWAVDAGWCRECCCTGGNHSCQLAPPCRSAHSCPKLTFLNEIRVDYL